MQLGSFWKFNVVVVQNNGKEMYKKSVRKKERHLSLSRAQVSTHRNQVFLKVIR